MSKLTHTQMELLSKKEHASKDKNVITGQEIEEFFDMKHSSTIEKIYFRMKENCELSDHGIFRKPELYALSNFYDLIKYNVNISEFYKKTNKIQEE